MQHFFQEQGFLFSRPADSGFGLRAGQTGKAERKETNLSSSEQE
jgi:hypothetical protein